ncbi:hypothetical protein F4803DRAFT_511384 [Xylaria telfairii]|nr:hypothetical protein F4803DRAFT_511384 [Xylaria telfairii]
MRACTTLPWRCARIGQSKCRRPPWARFSRRSSTERPQNHASPIVSRSTAAAPHPRFDIDQQNKIIATAIGDLPLSPIMDPSYWESTMRYQVPKQKQGKAQNSVERQFRNNPYAAALATPVRRCPGSRTRLPSFFLQSFKLIAHPETGQPWWVPRSLGQEPPADPPQESTASNEPSINGEEYHNEQSGPLIDGGEPDAPRVASSIKIPAAVQSKATQPYGPSAYLLARQDFVSAMSKTGVGFRQHAKRLLAGSSSRYAKFSGKAVWREDMDSFILDRMRDQIVQGLLYLSSLCTEDSRGYIVKCQGWDDVQYGYKGSILWFGDNAEPGEAAEPRVQPGPFATYDITNNVLTTGVAVHNIPMLLGAEETEKVRRGAAVFAGGSLFMLKGRRTIDIQSKLWKLQGYLAHYREFP